MDPSLKAFGYVVYDDKKRTILEAGCIRTDKAKKGEKKVTDDDAERLHYIATTLQGILSRFKIDQMHAEIPIGAQSFNAAKALYGVRAIVLSIHVFLNIPLNVFRAKDIKENLTGDANAEKDAVYNAVLKEFPSIKEHCESVTKDRREAISDAMAVFLYYSNNKE